MVYLRLPPRIKVLEALGAIGDNRVCIAASSTGYVSSSTRDKIYDVYVNPERREAYSTDNGTRYRGYVGYPIIAVLMANGYIEYPEEYARALAGVPWKKLNEEYKKYSIVEGIVKRRAAEKGVRVEELERYVERVMGILRSLRLRRLDTPPLEVQVYRRKCSRKLGAE